MDFFWIFHHSITFFLRFWCGIIAFLFIMWFWLPLVLILRILRFFDRKLARFICSLYGTTGGLAFEFYSVECFQCGSPILKDQGIRRENGDHFCNESCLRAYDARR